MSGFLTGLIFKLPLELLAIASLRCFNAARDLSFWVGVRHKSSVARHVMATTALSLTP